jgi:hypothetical protein
MNWSIYSSGSSHAPRTSSWLIEFHAPRSIATESIIVRDWTGHQIVFGRGLSDHRKSGHPAAGIPPSFLLGKVERDAQLTGNGFDPLGSMRGEDVPNEHDLPFPVSLVQPVKVLIGYALVCPSVLLM